jgi:hypothetical protein
MNTYELTYLVPKANAGMVTEEIRNASEQGARNLLRSRYGGQEVRIFSGRMTQFGDRPNDRPKQGR